MKGLAEVNSETRHSFCLYVYVDVFMYRSWETSVYETFRKGMCNMINSLINSVSVRARLLMKRIDFLSSLTSFLRFAVRAGVGFALIR